MFVKYAKMTRLELTLGLSSNAMDTTISGTLADLEMSLIVALYYFLESSPELGPINRTRLRM